MSQPKRQRRIFAEVAQRYLNLFEYGRIKVFRYHHDLHKPSDDKVAAG